MNGEEHTTPSIGAGSYSWGCGRQDPVTTSLSEFAVTFAITFSTASGVIGSKTGIWPASAGVNSRASPDPVGVSDLADLRPCHPGRVRPE